jgi:ribosome biogenesis GTPase / thiamine phosphate phosphatase
LVLENNIKLEDLGWDDYFSGAFASLKLPDTMPGRVASIEKDNCRVLTASGEFTVQMTGHLRHQAIGKADYPAVGDWLAVQSLPGESKAVIHAILPRKSKFTRQSPGGPTEEQVAAANVDTVFLVSGLDGGRNLNLRRIERYLAVAYASGASPVIVLNKADLCPDIEAQIREVALITQGLPVHGVSATAGTGIGTLKQYLIRGKTAAFLGSSGVGKSALINALLGEERQATGAIRKSDLEGRHTTTRRELILLPGGGAVIDTPGMREIQLWGGEDGLDNAFNDISEIAKGCRFADCRHDAEPGCAVRKALEDGELNEKHFKSYQQLQREIQHQVARQDTNAALVEKRRWKQISKFQKQFKKNRGEE